MYERHYQTRRTPQKEKIPGTTQVQNNAGGFAWAVDDWARLDRFLVLGSEGGTYYVRERELTIQNAEAVHRCILADGPRVVNRIVEISDSGRAPKNDPALFALAMAASLGSPETKAVALEALPKVARTGTHLFHFLRYVEAFRGWGRSLRRAIQNWYLSKDVSQLAYQVVKYQARDGWSHRDALRLAHPKPDSSERDALFRWIVKGEPVPKVESLALVDAFERAKRASTAKEICSLIADYGLPREAIPTKWLKEPKVWEALLPQMPMTALLRNLGNLSKYGVLTPLSEASKFVVSRFSDEAAICKARLHPLSILLALVTYASGGGYRGSGTWEPVSEVVDALDRAFYLAFQNVEPTGKRLVLALDVSGSMWETYIAGSLLTAGQGAAAMALVTAATEPQCEIVAFSHEMVPLAISPRERLDDVVKKLDMPFGATDCALPMLWALEKGVQADAFVIYTDSETWYGNVHPVQALREYRQKTGIPAKLIVVGMCSNGFSIADPDDPGMLDVVGFDAVVPAVIADFIRDG